MINTQEASFLYPRTRVIPWDELSPERQRVLQEMNGPQIPDKEPTMPNLSYDEYFRVMTEQGGKCPICHAAADTFSHDVCVDRDPRTREVVGLLCGPCGKGLGHFRYGPDLLAEAAKYAKKHNPGAKHA